MPFYQWQGDDLELRLKVQPKASSDQFAEVLEDETGQQIKLRITAPPVDGKANKHVIAFLSKQFRVPKSAIELLCGETSRNKKVRIKSPKQLPDIIPPR